MGTKQDWHFHRQCDQKAWRALGQLHFNSPRIVTGTAIPSAWQHTGMRSDVKLAAALDMLYVLGAVLHSM